VNPVAAESDSVIRYLEIHFLRRRWNTVLRLTPSLLATSIALPLNGSRST
jgi:hypothetical protein